MRIIKCIKLATHCMKSHNVGNVVDKEKLFEFCYTLCYWEKIDFHFLYKVHQYSKVSAFEIAPEIC